MWFMYPEHNPEDRTIFNEEFNIGFGSPSVDKCSTCCQLESKISAERSKPEKTNLTLKSKVHKKRAEVFDQKLREEMGRNITFSYDCEKNVALPKIPDQATYYARHTQIPDVPKGVSVETAKLSNVKRLLVLHFGEEWDNNPKLEFFKNVFEEESFPTECLNEDEESEEPLDFDLRQDDQTAVA
ncbi:hypothetical protein PR048_009478 [Dryococelus australis]|uniref:Uncharacterized protein n=1 Tax=Dryococelus australis TaxID=614101 RepID=A0ABQ9I1U4_9NEOP|nr:hypothetical protein PR048_009478 [Dryococelus australis]